MTITEPAGLSEMKQRTKATWALGDYPAVAARTLWEVGERLVRQVGIGAGEDVLDVACGSGNAAIRAAAAGGRVVGVDLTPEMFVAGRELATEAGVTVDWREGDAEDLPFPDARFDVVLSVFGCIFAPRHQVAAHEMLRVLRPGGRFAFTAWTPESAQGEFFRTLGSLLPPPPPFAQPPVLWGTEQHVRDLFAGSGIALDFDRDQLHAPRFASGDEAFDWLGDRFGPILALRGALGEQRWGELRATLVEMYERATPEEYLIVTGRKTTNN